MTQKVPVSKASIYSIDINGLGHSGEGVGRYQDFTIFVPNALPGERVKVKIDEVKSNYAKGRLIEIETVAPERIKPRCPVYLACGGCQLQHLDYSGQLAVKRQSVINAISRIGKLTDIKVQPTLGADQPWYYRNKMQFPVGIAGGKVTIGCFAQGTHKVINTENCCIQHETNNIIAREMQTLVEKYNISIYDECTGQGVLRHVLGRVGTMTGEVMIVLVTATRLLPQVEQLVEDLRERVPGLVGILQNINTKRTNVILGDKTKLIWGQETITDRLGSFHFAISARSFFQINTAQAEQLYNKALEYAALSGEETVIDAYCGTGTISLFLAQRAKKVYGIEIVEQAIHNAQHNAETNQITNAEFIVGDATAVMPALYKQGIRPQVIVVDPPRAGCTPEVLATFARMRPARIVYVSCNPASLARDLALLSEHGYETREIQPVDMFPQTYHVECVALIERQKPEYIRLKAFG